MATTMYFIGTDHHRDEPDQLLPWFFQNLDPGMQDQKKFIFDGPGSQPMTRSFTDLFTFKNRDKPVKMGKVGSGTTLGQGWESNVTAAIAALRQHANHGSNERINLIGHSRGAVTCHMVAHRIKKEFRDFRVRIFAIDPVPGGERDFASDIGDFKTIPSNVLEYCQILMENHSEVFFGVLGPKRLKFESPGNTNYRTLAMPGKHGSCVKTMFQEYPESQISCALLSDWLVDGGVTCNYRLRSMQIAEVYAIIWRKRRDIKFTKPSTSSKAKLGGLFVFGLPAGVLLGLVTGSPTFGGAIMTAPIMTLTSSFWKNDRSADVPNSQRGQPFYINRHHETALLLQPEWVEFLNAAQSNSQQRLNSAVRDLAKALPNTYDALREMSAGAGTTNAPKFW
jgi:hypothetical protein